MKAEQERPECAVFVGVSLDGPPEVQDAARPLAGGSSYALAAPKVRALLDSRAGTDLKTHASVVVTRLELDLVKRVAKEQRLPVVLFCAGGIATPADAALMMQLGAEGNFVGSGIFKSGDPAKRAKAIVEATTHFTDAKLIAEVSRGLGEPMRGLALETIPPAERLAVRGW